MQLTPRYATEPDITLTGDAVALLEALSIRMPLEQPF